MKLPVFWVHIQALTINPISLTVTASTQAPCQAERKPAVLLLHVHVTVGFHRRCSVCFVINAAFPHQFCSANAPGKEREFSRRDAVNQPELRQWSKRGKGSQQALNADNAV